MKRSLSIVFVALLSFPACKSEDPSGKSHLRQDTGPDTPLLSLALSRPLYGEGGLKSGTIEVDIVGAAGIPALPVLQKAVIHSYPGMVTVDGSWESTKVGHGSFVFTPAKALPDGDYIIRFPHASEQRVEVLPRPYSLFTIGGAPARARVIEITPNKATKGVTIQVLFNVTPDKDSVVLGLASESAEGQWKALEGATVSADDGLKLSLSSLDLKRRLRVTLTGAGLDGKWTGVAGSGPYEVEFIPAEYAIDPGQVRYFVPPDLSIELPSGKPKKS